jgi:hypothetical protein
MLPSNKTSLQITVTRYMSGGSLSLSLNSNLLMGFAGICKNKNKINNDRPNNLQEDSPGPPGQSRHFFFFEELPVG